MMRRLLRFFSRRAGKPQGPGRPVGDSPEDWNPGDLAECVHQGPWFSCGGFDSAHGDGPKFGEIRVVESVMVESHMLLGQLTGLRFRRWSKPFAANAFRKITPRADNATRGDVASLDDLLTIGQPAPVRPEPVQPERVP